MNVALGSFKNVSHAANGTAVVRKALTTGSESFSPPNQIGEAGEVTTERTTDQIQPSTLEPGPGAQKVSVDHIIAAEKMSEILKVRCETAALPSLRTDVHDVLQGFYNATSLMPWCPLLTDYYQLSSSDRNCCRN